MFVLGNHKSSVVPAWFSWRAILQLESSEASATQSHLHGLFRAVALSTVVDAIPLLGHDRQHRPRQNYKSTKSRCFTHPTGEYIAFKYFAVVSQWPAIPV